MARRPLERASSKTTFDPRAEFQREVVEKFEEACAHVGGTEEHFFNIAGRTLRLSFAGSSLSRRLTKAFEHLRVAATSGPDVRVGIWDEASSGVGAPRFLWKDEGLRLRGDILHDWPGAHLSFVVDTGTLHYFDREAPLCACWVRSPEAIRPWERAAPFRSLLSGWAASFGATLVHGAVVGDGENGVLLTAPSGGGKSTTALASVARGLKTLGDDFVLVEQRGDTVLAHSLYGSAKVNQRMLDSEERLREAFQVAGSLDDGKRQLWLSETHPEQTVSTMRLVGLVVPEVALERNAKLSQISSVQVMKAMLPSSMVVLPGTGHRTYQELLSLVQRLPCSRLSLSVDHDENVMAIQRLLDGAGPAASTVAPRRDASTPEVLGAHP